MQSDHKDGMPSTTTGTVDRSEVSFLVKRAMAEFHGKVDELFGPH